MRVYESSENSIYGQTPCALIELPHNIYNKYSIVLYVHCNDSHVLIIVVCVHASSSNSRIKLHDIIATLK